MGLGKPGCEEIFNVFDADPGPQPLASARQPARSEFMGAPGGVAPQDRRGCGRSPPAVQKLEPVFRPGCRAPSVRPARSLVRKAGALVSGTRTYISRPRAFVNMARDLVSSEFLSAGPELLSLEPELLPVGPELLSVKPELLPVGPELLTAGQNSCQRVLQ